MSQTESFSRDNPSTRPRATQSNRSNPGDVVDQTKDKAAELVEQAKGATGELVTQAAEQAQPRLERGKDEVVQTLTSTAEALRRTGAEMTDQDARVGRLADDAADQAERVAQFLGSRDLGEIVSEVEGFARRQPALFLGAAFCIGLAGARFVRTSATGNPQQTYERREQMSPSWGRPAGTDLSAFGTVAPGPGAAREPAVPAAPGLG
jgi:hypothetical protein